MSLPTGKRYVRNTGDSWCLEWGKSQGMVSERRAQETNQNVRTGTCNHGNRIITSPSLQECDSYIQTWWYMWRYRETKTLLCEIQVRPLIIFSILAIFWGVLVRKASTPYILVVFTHQTAQNSHTVAINQKPRALYFSEVRVWGGGVKASNPLKVALPPWDGLWSIQKHTQKHMTVSIQG